MTSLSSLKRETASGPRAHGAVRYCAELLVIGAAYFVLAKVGLTLASIHPSATPIWPPVGLALAAILLRGIHVWPAIYLASLVANATNEIPDASTQGQFLTALGIAAGNTIEAVLTGYLVSVWSGGRRTFDSPSGVAKFALLCLGPGTVISAVAGIGSLVLAGSAELAKFPAIAFTWWLGDVAGALVVTPLIVLWATAQLRPFNSRRFFESFGLHFTAAAVGLVAFSPLVEQTASRSALSFLAVLPLLGAALRCGPRDTATSAFILSCFAVWGTLRAGGPFTAMPLNDSFLLVIAFVISCAIPSLILSAVSSRRTCARCSARRWSASRASIRRGASHS
jgi:integral membrane sensor domain MASE1